ncbi:MAG: ParM/StbA family protein [Ghiorsea sp.]|nr:ParM/StbA family protein [Ghiorsea sp.]
MSEHIIGIDIGFGFTKATNGHDFLIFKSIFGEAVEFQIKENLLNADSDHDHLQIEIDNTSYFIGELAERQSSDRTFTLDQTQFVSSSSKILALATLSKLVKDTSQPIKLVVGLPIGHYREHKDKLAKMLQTTHTFFVINANGERSQISIEVSDVRVLPQPIGTVMDSLLSTDGIPQNKRFATDKIGIIDVGFRTTDYTISDKGRYSERGSLTTKNGISRAFSQIGSKLKEACGIDIEIYRLYDAVDKGSIKVRGKSYDLHKITEHAFKQLASQIATDANQVWADDWDIDAIMITGGGGAVLVQYMESEIEGVVIPVKQDLDYRLHNVRGYYKFGLYTWANPKKK